MGYNIKLILIGHKFGKESNSILKSIFSYPFSNEFVQYDGFVDRTNIWEYYTKADFVVFPSLIESLGLPIYEGILLEKTILCSNHISVTNLLSKSFKGDNKIIGRFQANKDNNLNNYNNIFFFNPLDDSNMLKVLRVNLDKINTLK